MASKLRNTTGTTTKASDVHGKVLLMLVNEPPSDDAKFFKGKALTYYGRWTYKYEEAARKGAVGVMLVHKEQMASYPWEVVRNSNSGEKSCAEGRGPDAESRFVDSTRCRQQDWLRRRGIEPRQDDAGCAVAGISSRELAVRGSRRTWSARCATSSRTTWSRCCRDRRSQTRTTKP